MSSCALVVHSWEHPFCVEKIDVVNEACSSGGGDLRVQKEETQNGIILRRRWGFCVSGRVGGRGAGGLVSIFVASND